MRTASLQKKYHFGLGDPTPHFVNRLIGQTYAVILAGGHCNRLLQLTDHCAKAAVPFGGKFRIIDFVLSNCMNSGIRHIGVATQYRSQLLIQHIKRGWSFLNGHFDEFIDLLPAQLRDEEEPGYPGTASTIYRNLDILRQHNPDYILVLSGDHVYNMDYGKLLTFHVENKADMTMSCIEIDWCDAGAYGVIRTDEQSRVMEFTEKPARPACIPDKPGKSLISMGIYVFNRKFLFEHILRDADDPNSSHDFGRDLIPHIINERVYAQNFTQSCVGNNNYWRDIKSIDAYWAANIALTDVTPDLNMYDGDWPIWTRHEHSPPAKFVFDDDGRRGMAIDSLISGGCIISGAAIRRSLLFYDVRVNCYSQITDSVLLPGVVVGRDVILNKVIVDKNCNVPNGLVAGINAVEDHRRFHVSSGGITLITADALKKLSAE